MIILGVRASAQEIRYTVLEKNASGSIVFHNQASENRLKYPANMEKVEEKVRWAKEEFDRILRQIPNIDKIILKMNALLRESAQKTALEKQCNIGIILWQMLF